MMNAGRIARTLALSLLTLLALGAGARGEDVWRMAGTFNGWNASSDDWRLTPVAGAPGTFEVTKRFEPGDYRFKFVKNGSWEAGHFGAATGDSLTQPGENIELNIPLALEIRVMLDTKARTWSHNAVNLKAPVPVVTIRGLPTLGRMFEVDLRKTLTANPPEKCAVKIWSPGTVMRARQSKDKSLRFGVIPSDVGNWVLNIRIFDGLEQGSPETTIEVPVFVAQRYFFDYEFVGNDGTTAQKREVIWPYGDNVYRALVEIPSDGILNSADIMIQGKTEEQDVVVIRSNGPVKKGTYLVEIKDGRVTEQQNPGASPSVLIPGAWTKFTLAFPHGAYPPAPVYLTGDFCDWATPAAGGSIAPGGAIEMTMRPEATFETITKLSNGAHVYQYFYEGAGHADPNNPNQAKAPDGTPASAIVVGPTPKDFDPVRPNDVNAAGVRHDPGSSNSLTPISPGLGLADVAITTLPDDAEHVFCYVTALDPEHKGQTIPVEVPMRRSRDAAGFDRWEARIASGMPDLTYSFSVIDGDAEYTTVTYHQRLAPDALKIPDWAKGAVWYQIFPERFRNGNPLNDPHGPSEYLAAWNGDWYDVTPEEEKAWRERYNVAPGAPMERRKGGKLFNVVFDRRYGGDLQGVAEKLDELKALGVTALYLNPVFEAESMHKYDATDYRHIDDNLGTPASAGRVPETWETPAGETTSPATWTWTPADRYFVDEFLPAAHERGIKVIIDGVFNHTGRAFFAFQDVLKNGRDSEYADWYYVNFKPDGSVDSWTAWDGPSGWLPKFRQTDDGNLGAPVKAHLFDITTRWMDPNGDGDPSDGIDGWRLDVPLDIGGSQGAPFWSEWRDHVKKINPNAVIIAEIWSDHEATPFLRGRHFDTQMHYPFAEAVTEWLAVKPGMTSEELDAEMAAAFDDFPQTNLIHQNLMGSHDTDRYASKLMNPYRGFDQGNRIQDDDTNQKGQKYKEARPSDSIYKLSLLGVAIQAGYIGAPMIYYGDEYGMWGADDPSDRKPVPWADTGPNKNEADNPVPWLRDRYVEWFNLRQDPKIGPVLRLGDVRDVETGNPNVFAFVRSLNGREVWFVINKGTRAWDASGILPDSASATTVGPVDAKYWVIEP